MNKEEQRNRMLSSAIVGGLIFGGICALMVGVIFRVEEGLGYITSLGGSKEILNAAFLRGAAIGGLFGAFIGGSLGALISMAKNKNI